VHNGPYGEYRSPLMFCLVKGSGSACRFLAWHDSKGCYMP
jgi:hypothetical protein